MHYLVEIIRYGKDELGVQLFGVFTERDIIHETMIDYNNYRGGKYPAYYVQGVEVNPTDLVVHDRIRYNI